MTVQAPLASPYAPSTVILDPKIAKGSSSRVLFPSAQKNIHTVRVPRREKDRASVMCQDKERESEASMTNPNELSSFCPSKGVYISTAGLAL